MVEIGIDGKCRICGNLTKHIHGGLYICPKHLTNKAFFDGWENKTIGCPVCHYQFHPIEEHPLYPVDLIPVKKECCDKLGVELYWDGMHYYYKRQFE